MCVSEISVSCYSIRRHIYTLDDTFWFFYSFSGFGLRVYICDFLVLLHCSTCHINTLFCMFDASLSIRYIIAGHANLTRRRAGGPGHTPERGEVL